MLGDRFEGSYTRRLIDAKRRFLELDDGRTREQREHDLAVWEADDRAARTCTYVNCWHIGEHESMAMWQGYGGGPYGLAIRSTAGRLDDCLPRQCLAFREMVNIQVGQVRYVDYTSSSASVYASGADHGPVIENFFCKSLAYQHERELRAGFFNVEILRAAPKQEPADGYAIPVELRELIEAVRVSPLAPAWFTETVRHLCQRYDFPHIIEASTASGSPTF
jgi:hypothetical protein